MKERTENILRKLVSINTTNPPGNEMDAIKTILGFFPEDIAYKIVEHGDNRGSLILEIKGEDEEKIGFIGHLDTVPVPDESNWVYPPFDGVTKDGYMYGRGTADMKGGVTAMILTALHFIENNITPPHTLKFVFTADEESGGIGVQALRDKDLLKDLSKVFIPEPTDEQIGICEKGALWLNIYVKGRASHGSRPDLGINAIEKLYEFVCRLKGNMDLEKEHFLLGKSSFAITLISGGVKTNIIPEEAKASVDIRTIPGIDHEEILKKAHEICKTMEEEKPGISIEILVVNNRPPLTIDEGNTFIKEIIKTYEKLSYPVKFKGLNFYTDASQLIPFHHIPFVILGPGEEKMCHQRNERISIESVMRMAKLYISYIINS
ncbi:M20 family metallopeptidase [Tepidimicrobium xylanilyticum]|uniref:Probable succinyl-diaminopimelate desuccinylase n=1 Tax=Tepidimicrobium xylanilyticum TaxID=1123352 RepID=A0A1H2RMJ1_9FIRM|nr:M20 family metallopeptidase [Tepidimicrobium xylanilyticum]GMG95385.1 succinyl-diaminopimelate desuccinylase [Tepidimicrobium xylanilyticum]SDW20390.1 succinyl-diaminopimelate desuccinylase [Tepidimicrobium xylanilyticum]